MSEEKENLSLDNLNKLHSSRNSLKVKHKKKYVKDNKKHLNDLNQHIEEIKNILNIDDNYFNKNDNLNKEENKKILNLLKLINEKDIEKLKEQCLLDGGLIHSSIRRFAWPMIILNSNLNYNEKKFTQKEIENHFFYNQVVLDVKRCIKRFPPSIKEVERLSMEQKLIILIMKVLIENPNFHYYQGYHDICITFLMILDEEDVFYVINKISQSHLYLFMEKTLENTQNLLELVPILIKHEDEYLFNFLEKSEVGTVFSLSWVITWFSHIIKNNRLVERLFDLFIVQHYSFPVYLTVNIILYKKEEILNLDCEMSAIHQYLTRILDNEISLPFEKLILDAKNLLEKYPLDSLKNEQLERKKFILKREEELKKKIMKKKKIITNKDNKNLKVIFFTSIIVILSAITIQYYRSNIL